jgi:hypothetical protein
MIRLLYISSGTDEFHDMTVILALLFLCTETVTLLPHKFLLRPREGHEIRIEPTELINTLDHQLHWQRDVYENAVAEAIFLNPGNTCLSVAVF